MIKKEITVFVTEDGMEFRSEDKALEHEQFLSISEEELLLEINKFLSNINNYDTWIDRNCFSKEEFHICTKLSKINTNHSVTLTIIQNKNMEVELDEDFLIDLNKWDNFEKEILNKYNCILKVPLYYWSK